ncbi:unnamed protein product [Cochlearia groenlandica]
MNGGEGDSNHPLSTSADDEDGEGGGGGETVTLNIKYLYGSKFTVETSLDSTVESFKEIVAQSIDVTENQQRLIYKGRILKDHETLLSYGLQANHTIYLCRLSSPQEEPWSPDQFGDGLLDLHQLAQNLYMRRDMIMSDPQVHEFVDRNPEIAHMLSDPSIILLNLEAIRNPELMSNIESMPGGLDFLARLYKIVHEPLFNSTTVSATQSDAETRSSIPNANPLPNPWGQITSPVRTNSGPVGSGPLGSTSLYVGDLDVSVSDLQLFKAFSQIGPVLSVRVCTDSATQRSRGYGYVNFIYPKDAERAIKELNNIPLNGKPVRVMYSRRDQSGRCIAPSGVENIFIKVNGSVVAAPTQVADFAGQFGTTSLYVEDLDLNVTDSQLFEAFSQIGQVVSVLVCRDLATRRSLGYGYVNFNNPQDAERAIKELNNIPLYGKPVRVMYSRRDQSGVGNIFIKNLDKSIDQKALHDTFSTFGDIISCKLAVDSSGQSKGYGFVQFETEESAERAMAELNGMLLNDKKVYVGPFLKRQERESTTTKTTFTNVYVKHFADSTTDDDLKNAFGEFGTITSAVVMKNGDGESKGFGFVNFDNADDAAKAVESLNGKTFGDKEWYVGRAQKRSERQNELKVLYEQSLREAGDKFQSSNLFVKNLDESVSDEKPKELFAPRLAKQPQSRLLCRDPGQTGTATTGTANREGMALLRNIFESLAMSVTNQTNEEQYATELKELEEMGFCDREENISALLATNGNFNAAVERLLRNIGQ